MGLGSITGAIGFPLEVACYRLLVGLGRDDCDVGPNVVACVDENDV